MKKLMIAAAAAAMIGGAFAEGYDFTASVKTTKGKYGKISYTVNVGQDATGTFWWDDLGYPDEKTAKNDVKKMTNEEKADFAWNALEFDGKDTKYYVKEYYKGKWRWCYTFKFNDEECYRVKGSAKLKGVVVMDEGCCGDWEFDEYDFGWTFIADDALFTHPLLYRFGNGAVEKANMVEATGTIGTDSYTGAEIGTFAYAGQGKYDVKNDRIANISGNIVGVLENPDCESCCDYDAVALVFECDLDDDLAGLVDPVDLKGTAAFGTFSLKYNKKR